MTDRARRARAAPIADRTSDAFDRRSSTWRRTSARRAPRRCGRGAATRRRRRPSLRRDAWCSRFFSSPTRWATRKTRKRYWSSGGCSATTRRFPRDPVRWVPMPSRDPVAHPSRRRTSNWLCFSARCTPSSARFPRTGTRAARLSVSRRTAPRLCASPSRSAGGAARTAKGRRRFRNRRRFVARGALRGPSRAAAILRGGPPRRKRRWACPASPRAGWYRRYPRPTRLRPKGSDRPTVPPRRGADRLLLAKKKTRRRTRIARTRSPPRPRRAAGAWTRPCSSSTPTRSPRSVSETRRSWVKRRKARIVTRSGETRTRRRTRTRTRRAPPPPRKKKQKKKRRALGARGAGRRARRSSWPPRPARRRSFGSRRFSFGRRRTTWTLPPPPAASGSRSRRPPRGDPPRTPARVAPIRAGPDCSARRWRDSNPTRESGLPSTGPGPGSSSVFPRPS